MNLVNSSFGIGAEFSQSGLTGPSIFPVTSLALRLQIRMGETFLFRGAVLDGVAGDPADPRGTEIILDADDGALLAGEAVWSVGSHRAASGAWGYTRTFDSSRARVGLSGGDEGGAAFGAYALMEGMLRPEVDGSQGLRAFARIGLASGRVHRLGGYLGGGGSYVGLFPGRDHDELAAGLAAARNSHQFMVARRAARRVRRGVRSRCGAPQPPPSWVTVLTSSAVP